MYPLLNTLMCSWHNAQSSTNTLAHTRHLSPDSDVPIPERRTLSLEKLSNTQGHINGKATELRVNLGPFVIKTSVLSFLK